MKSRQTVVSADTLWADVTGAATVEAVIVMPFFIIIFASLLYMYGMFSSTQGALATARRCAWQHSMNNCSGKPEGCEEDPKPDDSSPPNEFTDNGKLGNKLTSNEGGGAKGKAVSDVLEPFFSGLFGKGFTATASGDVSRDRIFGAGKAKAHGSYYLMCNIEPATLNGKADGVLWPLIKSLIPNPFESEDDKKENNP